MITFFATTDELIYAVKTIQSIDIQTVNKLTWLFGNAKPLENSTVPGRYIGPRKEMITPWSTNAVEITQNMGIRNIERIEFFRKAQSAHGQYDTMLEALYEKLDQDLFTVNHTPENILHIDDIAAYNMSEGLALSEDEVNYLNNLALRLGRKLTDSEIFGFSQVNSEHCRHKSSGLYN
jgi:phosphoribosylformylglycinamidine synthase